MPAEIPVPVEDLQLLLGAAAALDDLHETEEAAIRRIAALLGGLPRTGREIID